MYSPIIDGHHPNWTLSSFKNKTLLHGHRRSTVNAASCHSLYESNHTRIESPPAELQLHLELGTTKEISLFTNKTLLYCHRRSTIRRSILPLTEPTVQANHTRTESPSAELQLYLISDTTERDFFLFTNRTLLYGFRRSTFKCRNTALDCRLLHNMRAEP